MRLISSLAAAEALLKAGALQIVIAGSGYIMLRTLDFLADSFVPRVKDAMLRTLLVVSCLTGFGEVCYLDDTAPGTWRATIELRFCLALSLLLGRIKVDCRLSSAA